ncbi:hypothetical protein MHK_007492, partial [Candidatus Magnetomorum sp. HK-1]
YDKQTDAAKATYVNTADDILDTHINFDLTPGATISGTVFEEGIPIEGFQVMATSDKTHSFGGTTTLSDGSYLIDGLDLSDDFVIKVKKTGMAPFYYHEISTTREQKLATRISTVIDHHPTDINIHMAIFESISGTIRNEEGKPLSNIWVNVFSALQKSGDGIYTTEDGTYLIDALPKSNDYKVAIGEHAALIYVPEEKTNVKSGAKGVDFTLRRAYQLAGIVTNIENQPIVKAEVELYSHSENFYVWTKTDGAGTFRIQCIPSSHDYVLSIVSPDTLSFVPFNESGLQIDSTTTVNSKKQKDIILQTGSYLSGYVYKSDKTTPIINAEVLVYSKLQKYSTVGKTDENGYYRITNIPKGNDYEISVKTANFAKAVKTDQTTGTTVDFTLDFGGSLSGKVISEDGAPLANVLITVSSKSAHFSGIQRTDKNGEFSVNGIPRYLDNGNEITDFVVTIYPKDYAEQSQGQKRVGESITFVCKQERITGSVVDSSGSSIPDGVVVAVKVYRKLTQGGFVGKIKVDSDGRFSVEGLLPDVDYQLEVLIFNSKMEWGKQWIDENSGGVLDRGDAGVFLSGGVVDIRLSGTWDD